MADAQRNHVHNELSVESIVMKRSLEGEGTCSQNDQHFVLKWSMQRSGHGVIILHPHHLTAKAKSFGIPCSDDLAPYYVPMTQHPAKRAI